MISFKLIQEALLKNDDFKEKANPFFIMEALR
jgi:hypothetical protein